MTKTVDDGEDFDDVDALSDDIDEVESALEASAKQTDARRRLEQLREEKELERLLSIDKYDDLY